MIIIIKNEIQFYKEIKNIMGMKGRSILNGARGCQKAGIHKPNVDSLQNIFGQEIEKKNDRITMFPPLLVEVDGFLSE